MLILFGKKLIDSKKVRYALTTIFGIGISNSIKICNFLNIPNTIKVSELTEYQKLSLSTYLKQHFIVEAKLKQKIHENIDSFILINSVKGFRHRSKLPVRGQRTHSNAKTCKKISKF
jgi:small subunit ribosomal protein S13